MEEIHAKTKDYHCYLLKTKDYSWNPSIDFWDWNFSENLIETINKPNKRLIHLTTEQFTLRLCKTKKLLCGSTNIWKLRDRLDY